MNATTSPRMTARIAGALYLIIMVLAMFAEAFVRGPLIVSGDAAATAHNILASEQLYRLGGGADIVVFMCDAALAALFYVLLRPVSKSLAILAAFFRLAYAAIVAVNTIALFAPLVLLKGSGLAAFSTAELEALALLALKLHATGFNIALAFFGVHCVLLGCLIAGSRFLPALLGWVLVVVGACYLVDSATHLVFTNVDLYPWILLPGFLGEAALTLWLIFVGLNPSKWNQVNTGAATP